MESTKWLNVQKTKLEIPGQSYGDMVSKLELIISLCDRELLRHPVSKAETNVKDLLDSAALQLCKAKKIIEENHLESS